VSENGLSQEVRKSRLGEPRADLRNSAKLKNDSIKHLPSGRHTRARAFARRPWHRAPADASNAGAAMTGGETRELCTAGALVMRDILRVVDR
jgi:hypothetical protein